MGPMVLVGNQDLDLALAAAGIAATAAVGPLHNLKADLCQTSMTIDRNTDLAALEAGVATFGGYVQGTVTWDAPSLSDDGNIEVVGTMPVWRPTDTTVPNVIYSIYFTEAVGSLLMFCASFDNGPLPMNDTLDQIMCVIRWRPQTGGLVVQVV